MAIGKTRRIKFLTTEMASPFQNMSYRLGIRYTLTAKRRLAVCRHGFHFTTVQHWYSWADARCFLVAIGDEELVVGDKALSESIELRKELVDWRNDDVLRAMGHWMIEQHCINTVAVPDWLIAARKVDTFPFQSGRMEFKSRVDWVAAIAQEVRWGCHSLVSHSSHSSRVAIPVEAFRKFIVR